MVERAEAVFRVWGIGQLPVVTNDQDESDGFVSDPEAGWRMRPSHEFHGFMAGDAY